VSNDTVEQFTPVLTSASQIAVTSQLNTAVAQGVMSAVEPSHNKYDNAHISDSSRYLDKILNKVSETDAETLHSGRRKKKRSSIVNDDFADVDRTELKEDWKYKQEDWSHRTGEKDMLHKKGHVVSKTSDKDSMPHEYMNLLRATFEKDKPHKPEHVKSQTRGTDCLEHEHKDRLHTTSDKEKQHKPECVVSKTRDEGSSERIYEDKLRARSEKDKPHKQVYVTSKTSDSKEILEHEHKEQLRTTAKKVKLPKPEHDDDSIDDMPHSDHESKLKESVGGAKHKRITDDIVHSESSNDKTKKRTKSSEESASDHEAKQKKTTDVPNHKSEKTNRTRSSQASASDHEAKQKKTTDVPKHKWVEDDDVDSESKSDGTNKRAKSSQASASDHKAKQKKNVCVPKHKRVEDDDVDSESTSDKTNKTAECSQESAFKSLDGDGAKTDDSVAKVVRQYRHQDSIRERTCSKTTTSRRKHKKTVRISNNFTFEFASCKCLDCTVSVQAPGLKGGHSISLQDA